MHVIKNIEVIEQRRGTIYPAALAAGFDKRVKRFMTDALGLTQFGINLITIQPGGKSSLRHWHAHEDEFVYVTQGELVLVQDRSEILMGPGAMAAFKAGDPDGHHFINRSFAPARRSDSVMASRSASASSLRAPTLT